MRGLVLVLLAGCTFTRVDPGDDGAGGSCRSDAACAMGEVCARTGQCLATSLVRAVHVMWTVSDKIADENTCSPHPDLRIALHANTLTQYGYAPVPCIAGKFSVDKLPTSYDSVDLGPERSSDGWRSGKFDAAGEATLDLPF